MTPETKQQQFGYVSLTGATNAGKSTLINRLVGSKVSIVSHKVQTTRNRILGITIVENSEIAFIDTPGIFTPSNQLGEAMVKTAWSAPTSANKTIFLIDSQKTITNTIQNINQKLSQENIPFIVAFNKIDKVKKPQLLELTEFFKDNKLCEKVFMISALKGHGVNELLNHLANAMPIAPWLYKQDEITDMPEKIFAAEITREAAMFYLHQEIPYGLTVQHEAWTENQNSITINQLIIVAKNGHKGIVLGKNGTTIKAIGIKSRLQLEKILQKKINLKLFVKVIPNWQNQPHKYQTLLNPS